MGVDQEPNQVVRAHQREELWRRPTLGERLLRTAHFVGATILEDLVFQPATRALATAGAALHHLGRTT